MAGTRKIRSGVGGRAIVSLTLGAVGLIICPILGPLAWYLGYQAVKAICEGRSPAGGEGIAKAGMILGIIGTIWLVLVALWVFFWGGMAVLQAMMANR